MNERIKELAQQAGVDTSTRQFSHLSFQERFAELLIRECAEVSFKHWEQHKGCSAHFSIREHFGIKDE